MNFRYGQQEKNCTINYIMNRRFVFPSQILVTKNPILAQTVLGTCVCVVIFDRKNKVLGMNHFLHPKAPDGDTNTRYGDISTRYLIEKMLAQGAEKSEMKASVLGGSEEYEIDSNQKGVGEKNVQMALSILSENGIPVEGSHTGDKFGRIVLADNSLHSLSVEAIEA